jgi:PKD repeat protein
MSKTGFTQPRSKLAIWLVALLPLGFVACPSPPPPETPNQNPVAAFSSATPSIEAGEPLLFSSTSSDPDGDALTLAWDFGDDTRGGGVNIAHVFTTPGTYTVQLTASDARGGSSQTTGSVTVNPGAPLGAAVAVKGAVTDTLGNALAGVRVKLGSSDLGVTDAGGNVAVDVPTGAGQVLTLTKAGFVDQIVRLQLPTGSNAGNAWFNASMLTEAPAQTLNASAGGSLTGADNARLTLSAAALETEGGASVSGDVQISITPMDVSDPAILAAAPGALEAVQSDGTRTGIVSLGMADFTIRQNGQQLNLKPGSSATIRIPLYADAHEDGTPIKPGDTVPLWSMNEQTGEWVQEGAGVVVDSGNGARALEATVTHFSRWNADQPYNTTRPKPKCTVPPDLKGVLAQVLYCKFLFEATVIFGEGSAVRAQNVPLRPPAFRAIRDLPVAGGLAVALPARTQIRYTACVLEGAYCGSVTKSFAAGTSEEVEVVLQPVAAEPIPIPFEATRAIVNTQRFEFTVGAPPSDLSVTLERAANSSLNATARLIAPDGAQIIAGNISAEGFKFAKRLSTPGKYVLEVNPIIGNPTGDLRLRVLPVALETITVPFDATRTLTSPHHWFQWTNAGTSNLAFTLERSVGSGLNAAVTLYDPSGAVIYTGSLGADPLEFVRQLGTPGTLILELAATSGGALRMGVKPVTNDPTNTIAFDSDVNGALTGRQVHTYTFQGTAGQKISLDSAGPLGQPVANLGWNFPGNESLWNGIVTLAQTGTHTVTMTNNTDTPTSYRLRINTVQAPTTLNTLDPITEITTSVNLGEVRRYVFNPPLTLGEVIAFKLESATIQTSVTAFLDGPGVAGNVVSLANVAPPKTSIGDIIFMPITAPYGLHLFDSSDYLERRGGAFKLSIFRPSAQTFALDSSVSGSIAPNTILTHRVNVPVNGSYLLRGIIASGNNVTAEIWNSDVPRIVGNVNSGDKSEFRFPLKADTPELTGSLKAGNHTISVHNRRINTANPINTPTNYSVSLVTLEEPTDVVLGAPAVNGVIDVPGERDYYRFEATIGQTFTITATSPAFTGTLRVHKLSTTLDFSRADGGSYIFGGLSSGGIKPLGTHGFTIPNTANGGTGTYIIEIDATGAQTGAYSVALNSP